ncbi:uncharacterized protein LOC111359160 [Spodoptera litura]|uniref:Uncharacterized protein LOC111359160 n=1 Tax=Spodoptera litura TaxID=69820 RepID=A0A9J7ELW6_SPOLT|nr:uncharacterized protein LOC111359160 [Spodoptera litura]
MSLLAVCVTLIYVPVSFSASSDNDVYHTLFGKLATFKDLFINDEVKINNKDTKTRRSDDIMDEDLYTLDLEIPDVIKCRPVYRSMNYTFDLHDYHHINDQYENFTRQFPNKTRRYYPYERDDKFANNVIEQHKKGRVANLLVQFLMHSKYELGKALTQRDLIRQDKRYQLGYLFNRLRRLKTELFKMVGVAYNQYHIKKYYTYYTMHNLMRSYERVVHFDIDIRDTCELIKQVFSVPKIYDVYSKKKKKKEGDDDDSDDGDDKDKKGD